MLKRSITKIKLMKPLIHIVVLGLLMNLVHADQATEERRITLLAAAFKNKININHSTSYAVFHSQTNPDGMGIEPKTQELHEIRTKWRTEQNYNQAIDLIFNYAAANCYEYAVLAGIMLSSSQNFSQVEIFEFKPGDHVFVLAQGMSKHFYLFDAWADKYRILGPTEIQRITTENVYQTNPCPINTTAGNRLCVYPEIIFGTKAIPPNNFVSANSHSVFFQYATDEMNYLKNNNFYPLIKYYLGL